MKNVEDIYPLSPMQQGMLFHALQAPDSEVYCEQMSCSANGKYRGKVIAVPIAISMLISSKTVAGKWWLTRARLLWNKSGRASATIPADDPQTRRRCKHLSISTA